MPTGYLYTGLSADERFSTANINSYVLGGYAGGALGHGLALRSGGTWTWNDVDSARSVVFPGFFEAENANYNGDVGQLFVELAYPLFTHGGVVEPFGRVGLCARRHRGVHRKRPGRRLDERRSRHEPRLRHARRAHRHDGGVGRHDGDPARFARLAVRLRRYDAAAGAGLRLDGDRMGIGGVPLAQNSALVEVGADALIGPEATLGLSYIGQYSGDFTDSGLRGRFNWRY
ncbi:MAG: autotransporter outer membrane beta-barrel domain-containing protein [Hyphomicrobium sp.]